MTVLYEALNHKSRTFFIQNLKPLFDNLHGIINLHLIPSGKSIQSAPGAEIVCRGGVPQCYIMKWQACVIDFYWSGAAKYTDPIRQEVFNFIMCTFKNSNQQNVTNTVESCANQYIDTSALAVIPGCVTDGVADSILSNYTVETKKMVPNLQEHAFPSVFIEDKEVADLNTLKTQICALFVSDI